MARVAARVSDWFGAALWGVIQSGSIIVVLIGWELLARSGLFTAFLLPTLSSVLARVVEDAVSGLLFLDLSVTLYRAVLGFAIAAAAGVALGILIARIPSIHWLFDPIVSIGFPMPKVAFLPVFMLWFGVYDLSKVSMIVFNAIFPVIAATVAGTQGVDKHMIWSARSLGAKERDILREIILPAALPQILTGLQVALPTALIVAIVTEIIMGGDGLGASMIRASRYADSPGVFAGIVEIAAAGWLVIKSVEAIRRRLLVWHQETQAVSTV
ncbi:MAG: ABC transporter permease [Alphaproteobacteria bacterium]|nr:ABC transporter permease [Alphaproteobacteria bacterium]